MCAGRTQHAETFRPPHHRGARRRARQGVLRGARLQGGDVGRDRRRAVRELHGGQGDRGRARHPGARRGRTAHRDPAAQISPSRPVARPAHPRPQQARHEPYLLCGRRHRRRSGAAQGARIFDAQRDHGFPGAQARVHRRPRGRDGRALAVALNDALHELGVADAATAIRSGALRAEVLAEALLVRCAAAAKLNAFISLDPERVRAAARLADPRRARGEQLGALHGGRSAIKASFATADYPTTAGTPALARHRPKHNAAVVARLIDAGAIVLGKANLQELAFGPTSNNAAFGPVHNPYDPTRIPGGSSGGTGAAVAARLAPAGLGTDTGGSIRVPASLSGVVGFRPSMLRWPQAGIVPISHTRDTAAPLTRSVADCVLLDAVVTGGATALAAADLRGLRLGVPRAYFWENLDREVARIAHETLARLTAAGAVLVDGDIADIAALDAAGGFPVALYEFVADMNRYLADHATGLDFAAVAAQVKSPLVKKIVDGLLGDQAVPEA